MSHSFGISRSMSNEEALTGLGSLLDTMQSKGWTVLKKWCATDGRPVSAVIQNEEHDTRVLEIVKLRDDASER